MKGSASGLQAFKIAYAVSQPVADEFHVQDNAPLGTETATRAAIIQIDWSMMLRHVAQRLVKSETQ